MKTKVPLPTWPGCKYLLMFHHSLEAAWVAQHPVRSTQTVAFVWLDCHPGPLVWGSVARMIRDRLSGSQFHELKEMGFCNPAAASRFETASKSPVSGSFSAMELRCCTAL